MLKFRVIAPILALAAMLGGCGGFDGVELNGRMFDWMGVSEAAQANKRGEPRLAERAPLVMPPAVKQLPEPGSELDYSQQLAAVDDPDVRKARSAADQARLHKEYCSGDRNWKERVNNPGSPDLNRSPYGPCNQFIGNIFQQMTNGQPGKQ